MEAISFKTRVKTIMMEEALRYKHMYVDYEYLIFMNQFNSKYYIISGTEKNYLHLVGVHTALKPQNFYERCINGKLDETDFDFVDEAGRDIKGTVRRKIKMLPYMNELMDGKRLFVQEKFIKNRVVCTIGTTNNACTVGFVKTSGSKQGKTFPKTLMKGNELQNAVETELLLRRRTGSNFFDEIVIGNKALVRKYSVDLKDVVAASLYGETEENWSKCLNKIPTGN